MRRAPSLLSSLVCVSALGCTLDASGGDPASAGAGGPGAGGSTSTGTSGASGGGSDACAPGLSEDCYPADPGTRGVGPCKAGERTCTEAGSWGDCTGAVVPATEVCATAEDESCDGVAACTGAVTRAVLLGDANEIGGEGLASDASGNVVLGAGISGTLSIGAGATTVGGLDLVLVKLGEDAEAGVVKAFGDAALQTAHGVATDGAGNIVLGGAFSGQLDLGGAAMQNDGDDGTQDAFVAKLDPSGARLWSHDWGDADDQDVFDVAVDPSDHVVVVGKQRGTMDMGPGAVTAVDEDVFVARLTPAGETLWSHVYGGPGRQVAFAVSVASTGDLVTVGQFASTLDLGGPALEAQSLDAFVARFSADGAHVFSRGFGGPGDDTAVAVAVDGDGGAVVVGEVRGTADLGCGALAGVGSDADVYVVEYDASGNCAWAKRFGDGSDQFARGVVVDEAGQIVVVGELYGTMSVGSFSLVSAGGADVFVLKLDGAGEVVWAQRFGDTSAGQRGLAVTRGPLGGAWVYGSFDGTLPLGAIAGTLTATASADPFLCFVAP